jgi:cholesterol transport system auxiliary component
MRRVTIKTFAALGLLASLSLGGCVTLLPKQKPVNLYRFSYDPSSLGKESGVRQAPLNQTVIPVALNVVMFPQASAGDRVLTSENNQLSYVAESRWAVPAQVLFTEALSDGFARAGQGLELETHGPGAANFRLELNVRKFETDYHHGRATVRVDMDARLVRISDHGIVGQRYVTADVSLPHNNMTDMVEAYDKATTEAVMSLIDFTQASIATSNDAVVNPAPGQVPVAK